MLDFRVQAHGYFLEAVRTSADLVRIKLAEESVEKNCSIIFDFLFLFLILVNLCNILCKIKIVCLSHSSSLRTLQHKSHHVALKDMEQNKNELTFELEIYE